MMRLRPRLAAFLCMLILGLSACGGNVAVVEPTATPSAPPTVVPSATVAQATPTVAPTVEPTVAVPPASGTLAWRDQILRSDAVVVAVTGLPDPPAGQVYAAWLANDEGSLALGSLRPGSNGIATLTYVSPTQANLLGNYAQVYISEGTPDQATAPENVVMSGALPEQALVPIREILVRSDATPGGTGFALGLRQETDELLRHTQFLKDAFDAGDLALEQVHAEHLINIIRGSEARDVNGDGKVQNPGDGFGLLPNGQQAGYIEGLIDQAQRAAAAPDATAEIQLHAGHVEIAGENTRDRIEEIRGVAEQVAAASSLEETQQDVLTLLALAQQAIQGIDLDLDEQVGPIPGEGGVLTAYQHAQLMAAILLTSGNTDLPVPAPTIVTEQAATAEAVEIGVGDNTFTPNKITVVPGTTVTWTHTGQRPHTVTADDGSFVSGTIQPGDTFSFTFEQPGTFPYYCEFHGGPAGEGMAGAIIVAAPASASLPALVATQPAQPTASLEPSATAATEEPAAEAGETAGEVTVTIEDNQFTEGEITIPVGATVTWIHTGQRPHTVTADDGSFNSNTLNNGDTFSHTFDQPGLYPYYCEVHGGSGGRGMAGVIRVGAADAEDQSSNAPDQAAASETTTIVMRDSVFEPQTMTVPVGSTITWRNEGQKAHSATSVDGAFDTGLFGSGMSQSLTFNQPGTFVYFCQLHGDPNGADGMVGTIIVTP